MPLADLSISLLAYASRCRNLGLLELPKLTLQVIRRTTATLAQKMGTVKDVQGLLQHSHTATTTGVYMQEIPGGRSGNRGLDPPRVEIRRQETSPTPGSEPEK